MSKDQMIMSKDQMIREIIESDTSRGGNKQVGKKRCWCFCLLNKIMTEREISGTYHRYVFLEYFNHWSSLLIGLMPWCRELAIEKSHIFCFCF